MLPAVLAVCLAAGSACAPARAAPDLGPGWTEEGVASWYGEPFHGRRTASGEIYDMEAMTAAHPWLPFGSVVRVESRADGRSAVVRINDRGPFRRGRIIDLSRAAAREIGLLGPGTGRVRLVLLETPAPPSCVEVQVGAFQDHENAERAARAARSRGFEVREAPGPDGLIRVLAGPFADLRSGERARERLGGFLRACGAGVRTGAEPAGGGPGPDPAGARG